MTQIITIFKKEYRQQGVLAAAMILLCFFMQLAALVGTQYAGWIIGQMTEIPFFGIALLMTALFAGSAAALSFSAEHDEKTFGFLRNLPITPLTVMLGKTAWLVFGTLIVFAASSLLALLYSLVTATHSGTLTSQNASATFGVGILEAFVWGLFWSPRCRSQIHALLATYFCASITGYAASLLSATNSTDVVGAYCNAVPLRLGIVAVVAVFAVYGTLNWFDRVTQRAGQRDSSASEGRGWFRYPKTPQSPFFALLHQSIRQSQTILLCGVAVSILFCGILMFAVSPVLYNKLPDERFFVVLSLIGCFLFYLIFCGSIFAQDQKNNSFRYLSRCGISARKVWWSRVLPFLVIISGTLAGFLLFILFLILYRPGFFTAKTPNEQGEKIISAIANVIMLGIMPFAVGTFLSISHRSMIVATALIVAVCAVLYAWVMLGINLCAFNPLWTTLPICVAFIVASRLRTADWLRERCTWKSRLIPMIPLFVTVAVIFTAVPLVRIYSVPYVSLDEIETLFINTFESDSTPQQCKARFDEIRSRLNLPLEKKELRHYGDQHFIEYLYTHRFHDEARFESSAEELPQWELYKRICKIGETWVENFPNYEEFLLMFFEQEYRYCKNGLENGHGKISSTYILPWERQRYLRVICTKFKFILNYLTQLKESPKDVGSQRHTWDYHFYYNRSHALFDQLPWYWGNLEPNSLNARLRSQWMWLVSDAIQGWYLEHDKTLPDSLDELVGTYLQALPADPQTGAVMEYYPNPADTNQPPRHSHKPGCPYLKFGDNTSDLQFLPGYKEGKFR